MYARAGIHETLTRKSAMVGLIGYIIDGVGRMSRKSKWFSGLVSSGLRNSRSCTRFLI